MKKGTNHVYCKAMNEKLEMFKLLVKNHQLIALKIHSHLVTIKFFPHLLAQSSLCFTDRHKPIRN